MAVLSGRGSYQMYELIEDHDQGFNDAVVNNQQNLAMHYLVEIIADLKSRVDVLEAQLEEKDEPKKASNTKKTVTKKASKKKDDDAPEEESSDS